MTRKADVYPEELIGGDQSVFLTHLEGWLSDPLARPVLIDIYESAHGRSLGDLKGADRDELRRSVRPWLDGAFRRREFVAVAVPRRNEAVPHAITEEEKRERAAPRPPKRVKKLTWIEIKLVDKKGKPIPKEHYRIELPDGS
ncbi:MAG: hypothetical protein ACRD68_05390, partial [Pyrinomonadaceae bacterium]